MAPAISRWLRAVCLALGLIWIPAGKAEEHTKLFVQRAEDEEATYLIAGVYRDVGYLGASVKLRQAGPTRVFEGQPSVKYRLRRITVLGLKPHRANEVRPSPERSIRPF